jgi:predicted house-cleaning NTP pyrophosphatase (Maf/HAM1 superfamily)
MLTETVKRGCPTMIDPRIYLASRSPRRRELLAQIGVRFDLLLFRAAPREDAEVSEAWLPGETPEAYVQRVARIQGGIRRRPAGAARRVVPRPVLAADTTLDLDGEIIGKPRDEADAAAILARLSGRSHRVLTAIAMARGDRIEHRLSVSEVRFRPSARTKSAATCKAASRWTRPAPTASRAAPRCSSRKSAVPIPASSACRCAKPLLLRDFGYPL